MVCLLQPECNFLHGFLRCKLPVEVVDIEVKITSMQGTHIFRRDRTTQLIKCTPQSTRLCLHPTIIKKMKTFLEVRGKMGPIPTPSSQFRPHSQTPIPTSGKTRSLKREREPHLRSLGQQPPNLPQHAQPYQRPHQTLRIIPPYHQFQHERALHGPVQAKCQGIYSRTEIGCSHQITWKIRPKMNPKPQPILQVPSLRSRRKNLIKMNSQQINADGDWVVHSASP